MLLELRQITLVVHIFLAITWVGGILFIGWGVFPITLKMTLDEQRKLLISLMSWVHHLLSLAGLGVILTGVILGTYLGPIKSWDAVWNSTYGNLWFAALIIGIFTLLWGVFIGYREMMGIFKDDFLWNEAKAGQRKPLIIELIRLALLESVEVIGFITLIIIMVLL